MAWLDDHPPKRSQFRDPRRHSPSGVIVVHTAESIMDTVGPDTGAENVANFIRTRDTPGSYHELCDSNSTVHLVRWNCEAYHDGTGSNPHSFGLSFACRTSDWTRMSPAKRNAFIERGAQAAALYAKWLKALNGIVIPGIRLTKVQSDLMLPGFISHGQRDPGRRSDPGQEFPWNQFLTRFKALSGVTSPKPPTTQPPTLEDDMAIAVRGNQSMKVFATDWIHKNHIPDPDDLQQMILTGLRTQNGQPFVVAQATIDAIPEVTP